MRGKKLFTIITATFLTGAIFISACKKDDDNDDLIQKENTDFGLDNARMDQLINDAQTFTDQAFAAGKLAFKNTGFSCAVVTVDTVNRTVTVSFGTEPCLCKDGRYRKGKIVRRYTGKYNDTGVAHIITFENYSVNKLDVSGSISIVRKTPNGGLYYAVNASMAFFNNDTKAITSRNSTTTRSFYQGANTDDVYDDSYGINGYGELRMPNGGFYTFSIEKTVNVNPNCDWPKEGIVEITQSGGPDRLLNYGGLACDNKATLTKVGGEVIEISLD